MVKGLAIACLVLFIAAAAGYLWAAFERKGKKETEREVENLRKERQKTWADAERKIAEAHSWVRELSTQALLEIAFLRERVANDAFDIAAGRAEEIPTETLIKLACSKSPAAKAAAVIAVTRQTQGERPFEIIARDGAYYAQKVAIEAWCKADKHKLEKCVCTRCGAHEHQGPIMVGECYCDACGGVGGTPAGGGTFEYTTLETCSVCKGTGQIIALHCRSCGEVFERKQEDD